MWFSLCSGDKIEDILRRKACFGHGSQHTLESPLASVMWSHGGELLHHCAGTIIYDMKASFLPSVQRERIHLFVCEGSDIVKEQRQNLLVKD